MCACSEKLPSLSVSGCSNRYSLHPANSQRPPDLAASSALRRKVDNITEADVREALEQLDPLWDELFPAEQARIVQLLVEGVEIQEDGVEIRFRVDGLASLVDDFRNDREAA